MGVHSHSVTAELDPSVVWARWTDVEGWPTDDPGVTRARLNGPLARGAVGMVERAGGPKLSFRIVEVDRQRLRFVNESRPLLVTIRSERTLTRPEDAADPNAWVLTHRVTITGPLAKVWDRLVGRPIAEQLPTVLDNIAAAAAV